MTSSESCALYRIIYQQWLRYCKLLDEKSWRAILRRMEIHSNQGCIQLLEYNIYQNLQGSL